MPLSDDEKRRLGEIEAHVRACDPAFVRRLTRSSRADFERRHRRFIVTIWCLLFVGIATFANGISAAKGMISIGVLAAIAGAVLTAWSGRMVVRHKAWLSTY